MPEENDQQPSGAPEVDKSRPKPVVTPAAVKSEPQEDTKDLDEFKVDTVAETPDIDEAVASPETVPPKKDFTAPKKKRGRKTLVIFLLLIILAAGGYLVWTKYFKKANNSGSSSGAQNAQTEQLTGPNTFTPVSVAYAFRQKDSLPYNLYTRLAQGGGQHTEANLKLTSTEIISDADASGNTVAFIQANDLYVSKDGGKTYKSVLKINQDSTNGGAENQITSMKVAADGQHIVYGWLNDKANKNEVKSMDLDGKNVKTLFTSTSRGIFIYGYSSKANKVVYSEGCYNCDGNSPMPQIIDLKTGKITHIATKNADYDYSWGIPNNDFTKVIYYTATVDTTTSPQAIGDVWTGPYTVYEFDVASGKSTKIATFGTTGEKNPNGTARGRSILVGFVAGTDTPYYTSDGQLYEFEDGNSVKVYEVATKIFYLPFVGKDMIIAGYGNTTSNYILDSYTIATKKSANIYSGDDNTIIFGVTTK